MSLKSKKTSNSTFGLRGVGEKHTKNLARLGIHSPHDLLLHFPNRYQDRTKIQQIRKLIVGDFAVIEGVITQVSKPYGGKTKLLCELKDETGKIHLRFFHVFSFQSNVLKEGTRLRLYSEVRLGAKGLEMIHPEFVIMKPEQEIPIEQHLTPIYPATEGLSQYTLRKLTMNAISWMDHSHFYQELLPPSVLNKLSFPTFKEAIHFVHRPTRDTIIPALLNYQTIQQKRLAFEELLAHRMSLLQLKASFRANQCVAFAKPGQLTQMFRKHLPYQLTNAQEKVIQEINIDLQQSHPMLRLLQGDVGSGKTVVAAFALLQAIENNCQGALMAPTELLAEQHYRVFKKWFEPLAINVVFLSGHVKGKARKETLAAIANGEAQVILGTHALFQDEVHFKNLALIIVDEQHRFGVEQRALLRDKGRKLNDYPHQLVMTATPIPRTLAMSFYADLDYSILDEMPPGRTPVVTSVIASSRREEVIARISEACNLGRQAYWVCPLIDESELINHEAATKTAKDLQNALPQLKIGLIHGRLSATEKEATMRAFQNKETQLLVATTVIEVGVDVPNASLMIIENAESLGLSQLHQLRGRVGRGTVASHCLLLYQQLSDIAKERLKVMRETTDGFKIAERDLELRGPGEVFGTKQTGELSFRVANLLRDKELIPEIHQTAELIIREHQDIIDPLIKRWLGVKESYGEV